MKQNHHLLGKALFRRQLFELRGKTIERIGFTAPHARASLECLHLNERQPPIHIGMAAFPQAPQLHAGRQSRGQSRSRCQRAGNFEVIPGWLGSFDPFDPVPGDRIEFIVGVGRREDFLGLRRNAEPKPPSTP